MKRILPILLALLSLAASAQDLTHVRDTAKKQFAHVRVRTGWYAQAQFAGLYAAIEKGFFKEAGLEVEIMPLVGNLSSLDGQNVATTDFLLEHLTNALIYNDTTTGPALVQLLQSSQHTAMAIVSHRPIAQPADLEGSVVGTWHHGRSELSMCFAKEHGLKNIRWVPLQNFNNGPFIAGAVDAQLVMVYNELYLLELSGQHLAENQIIYLSKTPVDVPDDGLYVRRDYAEAHPAETRAFAQALRRGWEWLAQEENRSEGVDIVMRYAKRENARTTYIVQQHMLGKILELQLLNGTRPYTLSRKQFDRAVTLLRHAGFISKTALYEDFVN